MATGDGRQIGERVDTFVVQVSMRAIGVPPSCIGHAGPTVQAGSPWPRLPRLDTDPASAGACGGCRGALMKTVFRAFVVAAFTSVALATSGVAQTKTDPFSRGYEAYNRGDYATALRLWRPLAEQGNALAQFSLGFMYDNGEGVPQNDAEAVKWYRRAADQGDASAQLNLGVMYYAGEGVWANYVESYKW